MRFHIKVKYSGKIKNYKVIKKMVSYCKDSNRDTYQMSGSATEQHDWCWLGLVLQKNI